VSHKLLSSILLVFVLYAFPAFAQQGAAPPVPAAGNAEALTADQAKRALETLSDDKKRAQVIDTLRAIANASPQAAAAEPKSAMPLTADSLGAQLLLMVSEQVGEISREVADVARTLTHYRAFYYWFLRTANDPSAYQQLLDIAWKLALVFLCAFAAEWLVFRLIKRPVALLEARLPQTAQAPVQTLPLAIRHHRWLTLPRHPHSSGVVSAWRAPGNRWSDCPSSWGVWCSNCSPCSPSSAWPRCCSAPGLAISPPPGS